MKNWQRTLIQSGTSIRDAIAVVDSGSAQICLVVDKQNRLLGTLTDGDIRRAILRSISFERPVSEILNADPYTTSVDDDKRDMLRIMRSNDIHQLPVVDQNNSVVGLVLLADLLDAPETFDNWIVLMAGGFGKRLRPLTEDTPKPMLKVGNKPLLEIIIENFISQGFRNFYISVNYKASIIKSYFKDGDRWGISVRYLHEEQEMGTAGALSLIEQLPDLPLLIMNGDLLTNINFSHLIKFHQEQSSIATMCVREYDMRVPFGVVDIENDRITRIDEKPLHSFLVNAGIYLIDPSVIDLIPKNQKLDMTSVFEKVLSSGGKTTAFPIHEYWLDVGRQEEYDIANEDIAHIFK